LADHCALLTNYIYLLTYLLLVLAKVLVLVVVKRVVTVCHDFLSYIMAISQVDAFSSMYRGVCRVNNSWGVAASLVGGPLGLHAVSIVVRLALISPATWL